MHAATDDPGPHDPSPSNANQAGNGSGQAAVQESALKAEDALRLIIQQSGQASSAYPLWKHLSPAARLEFERQLSRLDPAAVQYFSLLDLALVVQWLFARHDIETIDITSHAGGLDLNLFNLRHRHEEYARIYAERVPPNLLQDLSETLEGREIDKVRLCTPGAFSEQHWKVQRDFPSFLEFWDREALVGYLREARQVYHSPRIQTRKVLPALTPAVRRRSKAAQPIPSNPAGLKRQFAALTKPKYLPEPLLTAGVAVTGVAFALSLLVPLPGAMPAALLWGVAVMAMSALRLYTGHRRRRRFRQIWSLLKSSSAAFEIGMPYCFRMIGYQVERVRRYQRRMDAERTGSRGIVVRLRRRRQVSVAYCASPAVLLTAMDIGVCEAEMEKHNAARGLVVIRGVFSLGAIERARLDRIALVDGRALRALLR